MNRILFYAIRIGACGLVLAVYLMAWRPVRGTITENVVYPQLAQGQKNDQGHPYFIKRDGVSLRITFPWNGHTKTIQYRPQAGFFFLIAMMTLVFISFKPKWYLLLITMHAAATLLTGTLIILSKHGWYTGFILVDLIVTYLVPGATLALAVWAVALEKKKLLIKDWLHA